MPNCIGRPLKEIDWEVVKDLAIAGCTGVEIAAHFNMHAKTFYDKCFKGQGEGFTTFVTRYRNIGAASIRTKQFDKALSGDTSLLIHLGKCRLGDTENKPEEESKNPKTKEYTDDYKPHPRGDEETGSDANPDSGLDQMIK